MTGSLKALQLYWEVAISCLPFLVMFILLLLEHHSNSFSCRNGQLTLAKVA